MPKSRVEAFSDGVFAIVITLLVLEIKVPSLASPVSEAALREVLIHELPAVASCIVSFVIIAIVWVAHHQFLHSLRQADWGLLWLNNLLLLFVIFIPLPTWLIGNYPSLRTPAILYGVVMTCSGLAFLAMRYYASYVAALIEMMPAERRRALLKSGVAPVLNLIGTVLALWAPIWAFAFYVAVPVFYFLQPPSGRTAG